MIKKNRFFIFWMLAISLCVWSCDKSEANISEEPPIVVPDEKEDEKEDEKDDTVFAGTTWETKALSDAVEWKYFHFSNLFSSRQFISVLDIDLSDGKVKIDIPYVKSGFLKTSEGAINSRATAAVNGSFFDTSVGGSTVFLKKEDVIINTTRTGFTPYRENAGFGVNKAGDVFIIQRPSTGWQSAEAYSLLVSGPLLVYDGTLVPQINQAFNTNRHPRTAIGVTADNHIIAVVVDGRFSESNGMTTKEMSIVMKDLGCVSAMNLDGGGSSTMWIKNRGVVNHPSDNKKFDQLGERGVATVISFIENF